MKNKLTLTLIIILASIALFAEESYVPNAEEAKKIEIAGNIITDKLVKQICPHRYSSRSYCRDPESYVISNEGRHHIFAPYITDLRGGYVGIAADANYNFLTAAKSEWVWLFDHDPKIVILHKLVLAMVENSKTPTELVDSLSKKNEKKALEIIKKRFNQATELKTALAIYNDYRFKLHSHYSASKNGSGKFGWLRNVENYNHLRQLVVKKRIHVLEGDLLEKNTLTGIGNAARQLNIAIRVYYTSNAEEYWLYNENYVASIKNLPFDELSVCIRTMSPYRLARNGNERWNFWHPEKKGFYWHHVVHHAKDYQNKIDLKNYNNIDGWKKERKKEKNNFDMSLIGF